MCYYMYHSNRSYITNYTNNTQNCTGQDIELVPRGEDVGATEEAEINWQEKLLSEREMLKYGDAENCYTVRDRQYHK